MNIAVWMLLLHFTCRESNCCLSLYLHVSGDYDRVPANTCEVLESPEICFGQDSGNPVTYMVYRTTWSSFYVPGCI